MSRTLLRRGLIVGAAAALALQLAAAPAMAGPRLVEVGSGTDRELTASTVSAGQSTTFVVTVKSNSTQKLQHTMLYIGQKGPGDDTSLPIAYPNGITASAPGCTTVNGILQCSIGTLGKQPFTFIVTLSSTQTTGAQTVTSKALVRVNEGTDSGPNNQAFAAFGDVTLLAFSCDSVTAFRANGASKLVATPCGLGNGNKQQSSVTLPGNTTTITLSQGAAIVACPSVPGLTCIGDAVYADITGDTTSNVVEWTLKYDITGKNVNTNKLLVYHWDDATNALSPVGGIALKNNACKPSKPVDCGTASITGTTLTIVFRTGGNGKTRLLG